MKQPERVAELLAELRALAENDFERHRIDVLERDLTAPPTVEIVDDDYQRFDGTLYRKRKPRQGQVGHYQQSIQIHQVVWRYYHGYIPDSCHIHHVDGNPAHNDIANLQCLTAAEHQLIHRTQEHDTKKKKSLVCKFCGKTFFASRGDYLYCSTKCKNAFYRHSQKTQEAVCEWCGKSFLTNPVRPNRFCSCSCSSKWRRSKH